MFNLVLFFMLCGIYFMQFKEKFSLTGVCKRMQRLEACVIEEELTPAIVAKQDQKAIEAKKTKWLIVKNDDFPNYEIIKDQLGNDEWASGGLHFASMVYKEYGLLFDRAAPIGHLFAGDLDFNVFKFSHVRCGQVEVFCNKKFTKGFKECLK